MIDDTLSKIEGTIQNADTLNEGRRRELLELVSKLKSEVGSLSKTHEDQARSIAGFTELSTHEATRTQKNPQLLSHALGGLSSSVKGFEETHPATGADRDLGQQFSIRSWNLSRTGLPVPANSYLWRGEKHFYSSSFR